MVLIPRIPWSYESQHHPKSQSQSHLGAKSTQLDPRCQPQPNPKVSTSIFRYWDIVSSPSLHYKIACLMSGILWKFLEV